MAAEYTYVEVEANDNTPMSASQVYKNMAAPFPVRRVRVYEGDPDGTLYDVTGWSSENGGSAVDAYAVQVEDSSEGSAYVVYGGDWGIRLRPAASPEPWDAAAGDQFGETHLVLADVEDVVPA